LKPKILFLILAAALGFWIAYPFYSLIIAIALGCILGAIAFVVIWGFESRMNEFTPRAILGGGIGICVASLSFFAIKIVFDSLRIPSNITPYVLPIIFLCFFYIGITI
jgi:hypothetical protein